MAPRSAPTGGEESSFRFSSFAKKRFWEGLAPHCAYPECHHNRGIWHRARRKGQTILLQGSRYCVGDCLERALQHELQREPPAKKPVVSPHRIPLGLLLLSRRQVTSEQLRCALETQRMAGCGRIGEWLQFLGFVDEPQVAAALARQWSCPILRREMGGNSPRVPHIPLTLLRSLVMYPIDFAKSTGTLHMAFGDRVDYGVLYSMERMLGCRTEPCVALPSVLRRRLESLPEHREQDEIVFAHIEEMVETTRIVRSYATRLRASEIRLVRCGPHLWIRMFRPPHTPLDLVLGSPELGGALVP